MSAAPASSYAKTTHTTVNRNPQRAVYDKEEVNSVLDRAFLCHVSYVNADGIPVTIPTAYARDGDALVFHGSPSSGMMKHFIKGEMLCVEIAIVEAIVMARAARKNSANYSSVVAFGRGEIVTEEQEKHRLFKVFTDHVLPERWPDLRPVTAAELSGTMVVRFPLEELSCKQRAGPPADTAGDKGNSSLYACVLPLQTVSLPHVPNHDLPVGSRPPAYADRFAGPGIKPLSTLAQSSPQWPTTGALFLAGAALGIAVHRLVVSH
eukprot:m.245398 g.245398  ORF g.245398 m.245398 type:complete len:264 (+) comp14697_c0_seq1:45-836(+)